MAKTFSIGDVVLVNYKRAHIGKITRTSKYKANIRYWVKQTHHLDGTPFLGSTRWYLAFDLTHLKDHVLYIQQILEGTSI